MQLFYGVPEDIENWMSLVTRVRWNFPGLETQEKLDEHKATVLRFMGKRQAICVKEGNEIVGVMLFSRGHNMICCLAVSPDYRRRGVATILMDEALRNLDRTKEISVSTFRADDEKGPAPRALYEKYGFVEDVLMEEMGYPNQKYILHPIGLKRGTVKLCEHEKAWEIEAQNTIVRLKKILGDVIKDIQHVGSTSIPAIKAKPIIDIVLAVDDFDDILVFEKELRDDGFYYRPKAQASLRNQLLFARGNYYDGSGDLQTHFIHVVLTSSMDWINYINFRDYLNNTPTVAKAYEDLKVSLAEQAPIDGGREKYLKGKHDFIVYTLRKALVNSFLGKTVTISIDRPMGSIHPKHDDIIYPVNYGYIPNVLGGDGEELDVYLLGVDTPVKEYTARIVGIVHRCNDVEDKLVAAPEGRSFTVKEITEAVRFQEQYYDSEVEVLL